MATSAKDEEATLSSPNPPPYQPDYGAADNVPPSYEDTDHLEPPPSYDSIYGQVKAAKRESSGFVEFMKKFLIIVVGSIGCTIFIALVLAIPVSMIAIGSIYIHDCPKEHYIPIYLIVAGCFGVLKNLLNLGQRCKNKQEDREEENAKTNPVDGILNCFLFAWFIAGNVWIYRIYGDFSEKPGAPDYCHPTLYYFAFWMTTATYIFMCATCTCIACTGTLVGLYSKE